MIRYIQNPVTLKECSKEEKELSKGKRSWGCWKLPVKICDCLHSRWKVSILKESVELECLHAQWLICTWFFLTPWTVARQVPLSMGFLRQGYWSGLRFPSPGHLPDPGIEPHFLPWQEGYHWGTREALRIRVRVHEVSWVPGWCSVWLYQVKGQIPLGLRNAFS